MTCTHCGGSGVVERSLRIGSGDWATTVVGHEACPACHGSGDIYDHEREPVDERHAQSAWSRAREQIEKGQPK